MVTFEAPSGGPPRGLRPQAPNGVLLARFSAAGALDCTFGSRGVAVERLGAPPNMFAAIAVSAAGVAPGGQLVVAGTGPAPISGPYDFLAARFLLGSVASAPQPPTATSVDYGVGTFTGVIDPDCQPTTYAVQYGATPAYGKHIGPDKLDGLTGPLWVSVGSGAVPRGTYHFRFIVTNSSGTIATPDSVFTVTASPPGARQAGCTVPRLIDLTLVAATKRAHAAGCTIGRVRLRRRSGHPRHPKLRVRSQAPAAGRVLRAGSPITLTIAP